MAEVIKVQVVADTSSAKQQLQDLQTQLSQLSSQPININDASLVAANKAAIELQQNLQKAMNPNTGKLDLSVFSSQLAKSGKSLAQYQTALSNLGPAGEQAFMSLARSIATAEVPTARLSAKLVKFGQTIKNTINWQISSSIVHGIVGQFQTAINFAERLNQSLNNIQIVTGQNNDQMAVFAKQANDAAKRLSTTTTQYTNASLIYYQQGLGDKEVAARTETTLKLANVSRQSVEEVSNQMTAIWNNYAEGSSNLEHYADVITALGAATASSSSEIATGLEKFAAIGKTVGLSYDYATTALATITSETRQSADTVGTGLRTLFSRLQGLKLGETLEDGVNLNKYSAALQTVGVNIQDQYGKVKDMDQILDALGTKWGTISKEQQIALAQTVGGVRQYTNLIALMDNWDVFQRNLKVAQGADGTLNRQAEVYSSSWEAARKRVQSSAEGIYDALIDDQAIIKMTNAFASLLSLIEGIVGGLGGMKGILLSIGSIVTAKYAKEMPTIFSNIGNSLSQFFTGRGTKKMIDFQTENANILAKQQTFGNNPVKDAEIAGLMRLNNMNQQYAIQQKYMSKEEKANFELSMRNTEQYYNNLAKQAQGAQEAKEETQNVINKNIGNNLLTQRIQKNQSLVDRRNSLIDQIEEDQERGNDAAVEANNQRIEEIDAALKEFGQADNSLIASGRKANDVTLKRLRTEAATTTDEDKKRELKQQIQQREEEIDKSVAQDYGSLTKDEDGFWNENGQRISAYRASKIQQQYAQELGQGISTAAKKQGAAIQLDERLSQASETWQRNKDLYNTPQGQAKKAQEMKRFAEAAKKSAAEAGLDIQKIFEEQDSENVNPYAGLTEALEHPDQGDLDQAFDRFKQEISKRLKEAEVEASDEVTQAVERAGEAGIDTNAAEEIVDAGIEEGTTGLDASLDRNNAPEEETPQHQTGDRTEIMGKLAAGALAVTSIVTSMSSVWDTFADEGASAADKVSAALGGITAVLMGIPALSSVAEMALIAIGKTAEQAQAKSGWIGLAISAAAALIGIIAKIINNRKEETAAQRKADMERADETREKIENNKELLKSYEETKKAYEDTIQAQKEGKATAADVAAAQQELANATQQVADSYHVAGTSALVLSGDTETLQNKIDDARLAELEQASAQANTAKNAAAQNLLETDNDGTRRQIQGLIINNGISSGDEQEALSILAKQDNINIMKDSAGKYLQAFISTKNLQDADKMLETYDQLVAAYDEMSTTMTETQKADSEVYANTKKQIDAMQEAAEAYRQYSDDVDNYSIERLALSGFVVGQDRIGKAKNEIKDLETYEQYRQALIDKAAEAKGITSENTEQYAELINAVDAYLGTLPQVTASQQGNLQMISRSLDDLNEQQALFQSKTEDKEWKEANRKKLAELYEEYGDIVFQIDTTVDLSDTEPRFEAQLHLLQSMADAQHIQVQIDLFKNFDPNALSSAKAWADFANKVDNDLWNDVFGENNIFGDGFDVNQFAALPSAQRDALRQQYIAGLNEQYYKPGGEFDQVMEGYEANKAAAENDLYNAQVVLTKFSNTEFSTGDSRLKSDIVQENAADILRARALTQASQNGAQLTGEESIELDNLKSSLAEKGISSNWLSDKRVVGNDVDKMLTVAETTQKVEALTESIGNYNKAIADSETERQAYQAFGFREQLAAEADMWGINYDEVQEYATALRENGQFTKDQIEASEEFALAQKKVTAGIELLKNNFKTYEKELKNSKKGSEDYVKSLNQIKKGLSGILGVPIEDISDEFVEAAKSAGLLKDVVNGVEGAVDKVYQFAGDQALAEMMGINPEDIIGLDPKALHSYLINNLSSGFEDLGDELQTIYDELPEFNPGDLITGDVEGALAQVASAFITATKDIDASMDAMSNMGVTPTLTPVTTSSEGHNYITAQGLTLIPDGNGGFQTEAGETVTVGSESEGGATIYEISFHKKGGGGGGKSGGGGGGKKEKDHKKPDAGTRYHTIRAKKANNDQNKSEASRKKDRAFGSEKIKQAKEEIILQKESIKLQRQYIDEITDYLAGDRKDMEDQFKGLGISFDIDKDGVITNFREVEAELLRQENELIDKYNSGSLDDDAYAEEQKKIDEAREALELYEETRDLYEEQMIDLTEQIDALADQLLDLTKMKVEIQIDISDDKLEMLDYMLEKINDDAYQTAEAIALLGDKTGETLSRIDIYKSSLEEILGRKGFSLNDLDNLTDADLVSTNFTEAEIEQIREWRSALLDANKELLKMREEIINKVLDSFDKLNEKVQKSYDNFDNYNSILESYTNITDLLGLRLNQQHQQLLHDLGRASLANAQAQAAAAKSIYDTAVQANLDAQKAYEDILAKGYDENSQEAQEYKRIVDQTQETMDEAQQQWLNAWQAALEKAQELYTQAIENIIKKFDESVSGLFGSLDYLQSAFDRANQVGDEYLKDFEKLYELNKLNRDIQKEIDDSNNIRDKQALKKLQKEINDLQAQGVQLSQYDIDALRKKFELEQARQALEDARNNKSEVRLQRDANGNWGYVYTAAEDNVAAAEQEYENKLYEYQKLNDDYINELQSRVLEIQATYRDTLAEIYNDTTLTDEQRQARLNELNAWKEAELSYFEQQLSNALKNQQDTLDLYYKLYGDSQAQLADSWEETTLKMLSGAGSVEEYIENIRQAMLDMLEGSSAALEQFHSDINNADAAAGVNTEDFAEQVSQTIGEVGDRAKQTTEELHKLSAELLGEFKISLQEVLNWEDQYAEKMKVAIDANEKFIQSINDIIARLVVLESSNPELKVARTVYIDAEAKHEKFVQDNGDIYDKDWEQAKQNWNDYLSKYIAQFDTGGYTGSWGSEGRMAILDEKELVLNKNDTENFLNATALLRTIDLQTGLFSKGLGNIITPFIADMQQGVLDQNVHIDATFPNVTDHNEIEAAFDNLINKASQYANRKNMSSMTFNDMYISRF